MTQVHDATALQFSERSFGDSPCIVHTIGWGQPIPETNTRDTRTATLRFGKERVLVNNVALQPDGSFIGEIEGFEPSIELTHQGMTVGDKVQFRDLHIFEYDV